VKHIGTIPQGDTVKHTFRLVDRTTKQPLTGLAASVSSQIKDAQRNIMATATITETETPGLYSYDGGSTAAYEAGNDYYFDIKVIYGGGTYHSEKVMFHVEASITV